MTKASAAAGPHNAGVDAWKWLNPWDILAPKISHELPVVPPKKPIWLFG